MRRERVAGLTQVQVGLNPRPTTRRVIRKWKRRASTTELFHSAHIQSSSFSTSQEWRTPTCRELVAQDQVRMEEHFRRRMRVSIWVASSAQDTLLQNLVWQRLRICPLNSAQCDEINLSQKLGNTRQIRRWSELKADPSKEKSVCKVYGKTTC